MFWEIKENGVKSLSYVLLKAEKIHGTRSRIARSVVNRPYLKLKSGLKMRKLQN